MPGGKISAMEYIAAAAARNDDSPINEELNVESDCIRAWRGEM
jgi:hypothetical protein